jgi:hypothetical protein
LAQGLGVDGEVPRGRTRLRSRSRRALAKDLVQRPPEASQQRGQDKVRGFGLCEQHAQWQVFKRYFGAGYMAKLERKEGLTGHPDLIAGKVAGARAGGELRT